LATAAPFRQGRGRFSPGALHTGQSYSVSVGTLDEDEESADCCCTCTGRREETGGNRLKLPTAPAHPLPCPGDLHIASAGLCQHRAIAIAPTGAHGRQRLLWRQFVFMDGPFDVGSPGHQCLAFHRHGCSLQKPGGPSARFLPDATPHSLKGQSRRIVTDWRLRRELFRGSSNPRACFYLRPTGLEAMQRSNFVRVIRCSEPKKLLLG
jgi:hypothetical protein